MEPIFGSLIEFNNRLDSRHTCVDDRVWGRSRKKRVWMWTRWWKACWCVLSLAHAREPIRRSNHQRALPFLSNRIESNRICHDDKWTRPRRGLFAASIRENTGVKWKIAIQRADRPWCARCIIHRGLKTIVPPEIVPRGNSDEPAPLCTDASLTTTRSFLSTLESLNVYVCIRISTRVSR